MATVGFKGLNLTRSYVCSNANSACHPYGVG